MSFLYDRTSELVSMIIVKEGRDRSIHRMLEVLKEQQIVDIEIVIVDIPDFKGRKSYDKLANDLKTFKQHKYLELPRICPMQWAINIGLYSSIGEYLLICERNYVPSSLMLKEQLQILKSAPGTAAVEAGPNGEALLMRAYVMDIMTGFDCSMSVERPWCFLERMRQYGFKVEKVSEPPININDFRIKETIYQDCHKIYYDRINSRVSVVISVRDDDESFLAALESIGSQSYDDIELVIVDDSLKENGLETLKCWDSQSENSAVRKSIKEIIYFKTPQNVGYPWDINIACYLSRGEFIAFHGTNGISDEKRFEMQVEFLRSNPVYSGVGTDFLGDIGPVKFSDNIECKYCMDHIPCINLNTVMLRAELIEKTAGLNREKLGMEDFEFTYRLVREGFRFRNLKDILYYEL